jgi:catechol 2,3-dioxygenase-like lactoylglutathione lyase family enzyme
VNRLPPPGEIAFANGEHALAALRERLTGRMRARGVFEAQLVTGRLDELAAFYRDVVGLEPSVWDPERGRVHYRLGRGQLILAAAEREVAAPAWPGLPPPLLVAADERGPTPAPHGAIHFALEVDGSLLAAEGERLRAAGLDVRGPFRWPDGYRSVYFRDPDGNVAELIAAPG